jgi:hypothetical protein
MQWHVSQAHFTGTVFVGVAGLITAISPVPANGIVCPAFREVNS